MPAVGDIVAAIKRHRPVLNPRVTPAGKAGAIERYVIDCGGGVSFHAGENLHFFRGDALVDSLKYLPLAAPATVDTFVKNCLDSLAEPLARAPAVQSVLARKYLGQETTVKRSPDGTSVWLGYPAFEIYITANRFTLVGVKTRRALFSAPFKDAKGLEEAFKTASYYAKDIENFDR